VLVSVNNARSRLFIYEHVGIHQNIIKTSKSQKSLINEK
jgi:hypothetical protein